MSNLQIRLLVFEGCPLAAAAREALEVALAECGIERYDEVDILDPSTPADLKGWGSPTILINGVDASGHPKGDGVGCRVYPGPGGVPESATLVASIRRARQV